MPTPKRAAALRLPSHYVCRPFGPCIKTNHAVDQTLGVRTTARSVVCPPIQRPLPAELRGLGARRLYRPAVPASLQHQLHSGRRLRLLLRLQPDATGRLSLAIPRSQQHLHHLSHPAAVPRRQLLSKPQPLRSQRFNLLERHPPREPMHSSVRVVVHRSMAGHRAVISVQHSDWHRLGLLRPAGLPRRRRRVGDAERDRSDPERTLHVSLHREERIHPRPRLLQRTSPSCRSARLAANSRSSPSTPPPPPPSAAPCPPPPPLRPPQPRPRPRPPRISPGPSPAASSAAWPSYPQSWRCSSAARDAASTAASSRRTPRPLARAWLRTRRSSATTRCCAPRWSARGTSTGSTRSWRPSRRGVEASGYSGQRSSMSAAGWAWDLSALDAHA